MKKRREMTCEEFTAVMAQLVASGEDIFAHPHVETCKMHRALLEDLETIARAARQLFPDVDPTDKLWERIEAEVAPLGGLSERVSDPFPGCRLVFRVRSIRKRYVPLSESRMRGDGPAAPPQPGEGRG